MPQFDGHDWSYEITAPTSGVIASRGGAVTKFNAYFVGGPELLVKLQKLIEATGADPALEAVKAMTTTVQERWRSLVVVGPGTLHYRDAIQTKERKGVNGAGGTVAVRELPGEGVKGEAQPLEYVRALEFGNSHEPSHPWARAAFESSAGDALSKAEDVLRKAVEGI